MELAHYLAKRHNHPTPCGQGGCLNSSTFREHHMDWCACGAVWPCGGARKEAMEEPASTLTVQQAWRRVMLKAPDGPGINRHVSLEELQAFIDRAKAEGRVACEGDDTKFRRWLENRNVALMGSQLYVDTPWGERR